MTKEEITLTDEGTEAYRRLVEEILREHFTALHPLQREAAEADLADEMDLDELEAALRQADKLLEGFWHIAEAANPVAHMMVNDTRERTRAALERVHEFRATWG